MPPCPWPPAAWVLCTAQCCVRRCLLSAESESAGFPAALQHHGRGHTRAGAAALWFLSLRAWLGLVQSQGWERCVSESGGLGSHGLPAVSTCQCRTRMMLTGHCTSPRPPYKSGAGKHQFLGPIFQKGKLQLHGDVTGPRSRSRLVVEWGWEPQSIGSKWNNCPCNWKRFGNKKNMKNRS